MSTRQSTSPTSFARPVFKVQVRSGFEVGAEWRTVAEGLTGEEAREAMADIVRQSGTYPANAVRYGSESAIGFLPKDVVELRIPRG